MNGIIRRHFSPTQIVILSFALVIAAGTALLSLPAAAATGERLSIVDAFFTAVSATCVTGLSVVDIGSSLSIFGQLVLLACIQIGGLGLMTFTSIYAVSLGHRLAIADRLAIQSSFHHTPMPNIRPLVMYIVFGTLAIEALAAAALTINWTIQGRFNSLAETIYYAVFHAVSAFCNAGFSLHSDSLAGYNDDAFTLSVISILIIVGGLGFLVGMELMGQFRRKTLNFFSAADSSSSIPRTRLSIHTKFVLITSSALLLIGTVSYFILERNGLFAGMSPASAWLNAYFCSVTTRTAGFATVDFGAMSGAALLCTMVLMFIGASPGSTGGGVKTSTFGVLVAYSISRCKGETRLNVFRRTIPQLSIDRAAGVVVAAITIIVLGSSVLMGVETYYLTSKESQAHLVSIVFETVSAFGTVGLSIGETPTLSASSKLVVALVMFLGRVGPVTLALAISRRQRTAPFRYAEENLMVG